MFRRASSVSAFLLLAFVLPASGDTPSVVVNGSFEQGPPPFDFQDIDIPPGSTAITGWLVTGGGIDLLEDPWDVSDGIRAIDLDGTDALSGGIEQTFATVVGQSYVVTFDLSGNPGGPPQVKTVRVAVDGFTQDYAFDSSGQSIQGLTWQPITFSFIATGTTATLSFTSLTPFANSYGALIDNVRVSALPGTSVKTGRFFTTEQSFLAAAGTTAIEGFEAFQHESCGTGGAAQATSLVTAFFTVTTTPTSGGTSFLCVGTVETGSDDPRPSEGINALIAGSNNGDSWQLDFRLSTPARAVAFDLTDIAEAGDALFVTDAGESAVIARCCAPSQVVTFFGYVATKPFKSFRLVNLAQGDAWGIDRVQVAIGRVR
jgi:choice-of-anchor C domain-containing protein